MKKMTIAAIAIGMAVASLPADAGWFGKARDAIAIGRTESSAIRGWIVSAPRVVEGGDLEVLAVSASSGNPDNPSYVVRFQSTEAADVWANVSVGDLLVVRKYDHFKAGEARALAAHPKAQRGWRMRKVPKISAFTAQWAPSIACRATWNNPDLFDRLLRGTAAGDQCLKEIETASQLLGDQQ